MAGLRLHVFPLMALLGFASGIEAAEAAKPPAAPADEAKPADPYAALSYRFIGPPGNRVSAVAGVPGDANTYYAGAASGGVWKSTDGGIHWKADLRRPARAVDRCPRDRPVGSERRLGRDGGELHPEQRLARQRRLQVDRRRQDLDAHGPGANGTDRPHRDRSAKPGRRLRRRAGNLLRPAAGARRLPDDDGGKTWERVLFVDENTGVSDLSMDATNPHVLFAGTWPIDIKTWGRKSGGPGGGLYVSRDGGTTWKRITGHGLPEPPIGKVAVAVAPSDPRRVYALIETGQRGSLWRSDDGGEKWKLVNTSRLLNERPHYYTRMLVMPDNANEVYFPSNGMGATYDGGETAEPIGWGGDNHDMWADPKDPGPDDDRQRRRRADLDDPRPPVELRAAPDRADVPRGHRQPRPVLRLRADAGRRLDARAEQQPRRRTDPRPRSGPRPRAARRAGPRPTRSTRTSSGAAATRESSSASTRRPGCRAA